MFPTWRIQLKAAEAALRDGRLEEASRLLATGELREYRGGAALAAKAADQIAGRGRSRLAEGDSTAGWRDLHAASALCGDSASVVELRRLLADAKAESIARRLEQSDLAGAETEVSQAKERGLESTRLSRLAEATRQWRDARRLARLGDFSAAGARFTSAAAILPTNGRLATEQVEARTAGDAARLAEQSLHAAFAEGRWNDVLASAAEVLALAPEHERARRLHEQAWRWAANQKPSSTPSAATAEEPAPTANQDEREATPAPRRGGRFLLWIDEIGGFLVCQGDAVVLGQPNAGAEIDVPLLADVSRRHAVIRREGESYVIAPTRAIVVDGQESAEAVLLADGARVQLASGAEIAFRRPHALSASARLELSPGVRTQPRVDGVLLMAETLILGPSPHSHIVCRRWTRDVVLFRTAEGLGCRVAGDFECDGEPASGRVLLREDSRVSGQDFALRIETL